MSANIGEPDSERWSAFVYEEIIRDWEQRLSKAKFAPYSGSDFEKYAKSAGIQIYHHEKNAVCDAYIQQHQHHRPFIILSVFKNSIPEMVFKRFRNSFAHAAYTVSDDWLEFTDRSFDRKTNTTLISMRSCLHKTHLEPMISALKSGAAV